MPKISTTTYPKNYRLEGISEMSTILPTNQVRFAYTACRHRSLEYFSFETTHTERSVEDELTEHDNYIQQLTYAVYKNHKNVSRKLLAINNLLALEICSRMIHKTSDFSPLLVLHSMARQVSVEPSIKPLIIHFLNYNMPQLDLSLETTVSIYRLLFEDSDSFASFFSSAHLVSILTSQHQLENKIIALRALSILNNLALEPELFARYGLPYFPDTCISVYESSEIDFCQFALSEAVQINDAVALKDRSTEMPLFSFSLSPLIANVGNVLVPSLKASQATSALMQPVATRTWNSNLFSFGTALQSGKSILVTGVSGSGKTFLIDHVARQLGAHEDMVRIHLGDQTDTKMLIGSYSTGSEPGSFEWRRGVLATAVAEGRWVLIEDIDKAPTDILSVLLPLIERSTLEIPSRGETIKAKAGFKLIATVTMFDDKATPDIIGRRLWTEVDMLNYSSQELTLLLSSTFPNLEQLASQFVSTYTATRNARDNAPSLAVRRGLSRLVSNRDLMKWARRVSTMLAMRGIVSSTDSLPSETYDEIFAEAVDCFASHIADRSTYEYVAHLVGSNLDLSHGKVEQYLNKYVPKISIADTKIEIGRVSLTRSIKGKGSNAFALTNHALCLIERIAMGVLMNEPTLLVGETGTGKTTVVQYLAGIMGKKLTVINLSQQTESGDLLGGFKPIDARTLALPLQEKFNELFPATFSERKNAEFSAILVKAVTKSQWSRVVNLWQRAISLAMSSLAEPRNSSNDDSEKRTKRRRLNAEEMASRWKVFAKEVEEFDIQFRKVENSFVFKFVEGALVKAVRNGDWVLLDEMNLAAADTLESITDLLGSEPSIMLPETGNAQAIKAHEQFRIFACMNPATDVGKKDLPPGVRSRFTEIEVASPDRNIEDLLKVIDKYIPSGSGDGWVSNDVADLYLKLKNMSERNLIVDGANQRPHFSIRTLSRTLVFARSVASAFGLRRALFEGFCMCFLTQLDRESEAAVISIIEKHILARLGNIKSVLKEVPKPPNDGHDYVRFKHLWVRHGSEPTQDQSNYIITPFIEKNLLNVMRAVSGGKFPVLIQGPTSSGKTSIINYLAKISGHKFVRINNHEHTDLQEYLGSYVSDDKGKIKFQEGVLVNAVRNGHWIVLDELNLAPTDVLEALNRLLDDNRELLIPDTQEVVKPHPDFMLFATQNPPGVYGGRKILSRAFRNRFLELHFDDIPEDELQTILQDRCRVAPSYAKKIVEVYHELGIRRSASRVFEQKNSFATLRDLFRWAQREAIGYEQLALNGYLLLGERCRIADERTLVKEVIEKVMKVKLDVAKIYESLVPLEIIADNSSVIWTKGMKRLLVLVTQALKNNEPVLLIGETGCGKTTICQVLAAAVKKSLSIVNAHQNTETSDLIGAQRPVRDRSETQKRLRHRLLFLFPEHPEADLDLLLSLYSGGDKEVDILKTRLNVLFEWNDGPLIQALKRGDFFLLDEISLADDSVLERLNSVLEPERTILLAERGSDYSITAEDGFQFFATMNPGGDYGKKELSAALRNRFTEIWVPSMEDVEDTKDIVYNLLAPSVKSFSDAIVSFGYWFRDRETGTGGLTSFSLRNLLTWITFVNILSESISPESALLHGACMVFIDALGTDSGFQNSHPSRMKQLKLARVECVQKLSEFSHSDLMPLYVTSASVSLSDDELRVGDFSLPVTNSSLAKEPFNFHAPTTAMNVLRVVRGLQAHRPILLEGSPGVGKTTLISALAKCLGKPLTRINLSEQTDLIDLFGADSPAEGKAAGEFVWRDAPFLRAMQRGEWVLLDELNLASQSVLEGLNACLDHRAETYIPELDKYFKCHPGFTIFAAQNPQYQGGGRKGLPKSFVNRFNVVYVESHSHADLQLITEYLHPEVDPSLIDKVLRFIDDLETKTTVENSFGSVGGPFEFNLRDVMRWLDLANTSDKIFEHFDTIIRNRFRTDSDRSAALTLFHSYFPEFSKERPVFTLFTFDKMEFGQSQPTGRPVSCGSSVDGQVLQCNTRAMETALTCIKNQWPLLLTGPSGSGKTSFLRTLAAIHGKELLEFPLNGEIDSTDILGGFDQADVQRDVQEISTKFEMELINIKESSLKLADSNVLSIVSDCLAKLQVLSSLSEPDDILSFISSKVPIDSPLLDDIANVKKLLSNTKARFRWFDGLLVNALQKGNWLVLDNANLSNPSVLDRLNSLLEPNGNLMINECALADGEPRVITPHPEFRLFLTMDPKYGELSRAMRNRSVELFMQPISNRCTEFDLQCLEDSTMESKSLAAVKYLPLSDIHLRNIHFASELVNDSRVRFDQLTYPIPKTLAKKEIVSSSQLYLFLQFLHNFDGLSREFNNVSDAQLPFNPLVYPTLLPNAKSINNSLRLLYDLYCFSVSLPTTESIAQKKISKYSYLDRCATFRHNPAITAPPLDVLNLFMNVYEFCSSKLSRPCEESEYRSFKDLLSTVIMFSATCQDITVDESVLMEFGSVMDDWSSQNSDLVSQSPKILNSLNIYREQRRLKTGTSMSLLWSSMKSRYPLTESQWSSYLKLQAFCDEFDNIADKMRPDTFQTVWEIKMKILQAMDVFDRDDFDSMVDSIGRALDEFSKNVASLRRTSSHLFRHEFRILLDSAKFFSQSSAQNPLLSYFGGQSIKELRDNAASGYKAVLLMNDDVLSNQIAGGFWYSAVSAFEKLDDSVASDYSSSFRELEFLVSQMANNMQNLARDKGLALANILESNLSDVISIHASISGDLTSSIFEMANEDSLFGHICRNEFSISLEFLRRFAQDNNLSNLGKAWTSAYIGILKLFFPDKVFDPAIRQHIDYELVVSSHRRNDQELISWKVIRKIFFGYDDDLLVDILKNEQRELPSIDSPAVFRPKISKISGLHGEWKDFMLTLDVLPTNRREGILFDNNTLRLTERLSSTYYEYSDIVDVMSRFMNGVRIGVVLSTQENTSSLEVDKIFDPSIFTNSEQLEVLCSQLMTLPESPSQSLLLVAMLLSKRNIDTPKANINLVHGILKRFHLMWARQKFLEEQEESEKNSLYKGLKNADESEQEFLEMFPDYEEDNIERTGSTESSDFYWRLVSTFLETFHDSDTEDLMSMFEKGLQSVAKSSKDLSLVRVHSDQSYMALFAYLQRGLSTRKYPSGSINFYHDYDMVETKKVVDLIARLHVSVANLIERWPEHSTLQNISFSCEELLNYPSKSPVARFLQKLDQIFVFVNEWQVYAAKEVKLDNYVKEITDLIVCWRKRELECWQSLFEFEKRESLKSLGKWWFYVYEAVLNSSLDESTELDVATLVQTLGMFLGQSNMCQFETRLKILRAFKNLTTQWGCINSRFGVVSAALENVIIYYSQYSAAIEEQLAAETKKLSKEVEETILLASWKDVNAAALKESARRSHHKLYSLVRKYRSLINGSVSSVLDQPLRVLPPSSWKDQSRDDMQSDYSDELEWLKLNVPVWSSREPRLRNIKRTCELLDPIADSLQKLPILDISEVATSIIDQANELKKETPLVLNDETKKLVNTLKLQKATLLSDSLKELRHAGLKPSVKASILEKQRLVNEILGSSPSLPNVYNEKYYYALLELLPRVRNAVSSSQSDIPAADLHKSLSMAENMLALVLSSKRLAANFCDKLSSLRSIREVFGKFADAFHAPAALEDFSSLDIESAHKIFNWAQDILVYCSQCWITICATLDSNVKDPFISIQSNFIAIKEALQNALLLADKSIYTIEWKSVSQQLSDWLTSSLEALRVHNNGPYSLVVSVFYQWADQFSSSWSNNVSRSTNSVELNAQLSHFSDSILVIAQNLRSDCEVKVLQDRDWLYAQQSHLKTISSHLHVETVLNKLKSLASEAASSSLSKESQALFAASLPFFDYYLSFCENTVDHIVKFYSENCKNLYYLLTIVLSLATDGFCSPQEPDDKPNESSQTKDGTGLGDGQGNESAKDIEQDEDFSEAAATENKEKDENEDPRDPDEEDNAVDIEGDMAGDIEDLNEKSEEENEEDNDDQPDEEVGDVDDLDPSAVDEKMWNDDEKDEKEGEKKNKEDIPGEEKSDDLQANDDQDQDNPQSDNEKENENKNDSEPINQDDADADEDEGSEEDVGEQDDEVENQPKQEMDPHVENSEVLDLPEDMELDEGGDEEEEEENIDEQGDKEDSLSDDAEDDESKQIAPDNSEGIKDDEDADKSAEDGAMDVDDENESDTSSSPNIEDDQESRAESGEEEVGDEGENASDDDLGENEEKATDENDAVGENTEENDAGENGLSGMKSEESNENSNENSGAADQDSGATGEGASESIEEQGGGEQVASSKEQNNENDVEMDSSSKAAEDSLKQLGDLMENFHRRKQEIEKASEAIEDGDEPPKDMDLEKADFEHVGENSADTQALGAGTQDEAQKLNEEMAIDDEKESMDLEQESHDQPDGKAEDNNDSVDDNDQVEGDNAGNSGVVADKDDAMNNMRAGFDDADEVIESENEMDAMTDEMLEVSVGSPARSYEEARELWQKYDSSVQELSLALCEQLRLILAPTQATKLRGDFKTGKRLNMKRIIPYIASQFKKDKIWMRRTLPSKRQYQIMISVDDSKSMSESESVDLAFQSIALVAKAVTHLEAGQLGITRFGETAHIVKSFDKPFNFDSGVDITRWFGFDQSRTDVLQLVSNTLNYLDNARGMLQNSSLWQLQIIISDGLCENHEELRQLVRKAQEQRVMLVFVIVDGLKTDGGSILDMSQVSYNENGSLKISKYLDTFPFSFYVLVKDIHELPSTLAMILRQYFSEMRDE